MKKLLQSLPLRTSIWAVALSSLLLIIISLLVSVFYQPLVAAIPPINIPAAFWGFVLAGFAAQMVDGALGMAYGVSSTSLLLSMGLPPASASAAVHTAEVFTTAMSGLSHLKFGNVHKRLFACLVLPGMLGAAVGAYLLTQIDGNMIKPYISLYLLVMGAIIIRKALLPRRPRSKTKAIGWLALVGGFVDSVGGGGWGPVVASSLIGAGRSPRLVIGSVNAAEFFVAVVSAGMFTIFMGTSSWLIIAGLVVGGALAAPIAAVVCRYLPPKPMMILVGIVIISLSLRTFYMLLF
ncbi:MAG: sulfite exporter TauE/SafE family protein [Bacteroidia bacterium]|nr:sulfite exporter TauE/SafE family protein [Bacteroidia bacterium]